MEMSTHITVLIILTMVAVSVISNDKYDSGAKHEYKPVERQQGQSIAPLSSLIKKPLRIGSFNIKIFGRAKLEKKDVMAYIVRIIMKYDVVLIQEIRDSSDTAIHKLLDLVNNGLNSSEIYKMVLSDRLGRSSSKEQYAYFYKSSKVAVVHEYVYSDDNDVFEREPYVVWFNSTITTITDFAIIGIHTKPSDAVNEINNLTAVYDDLQERHSLKDAIFAGDFNADCSYVRQYKWEFVTFRSDDRFVWLIDDDVDTTIASIDCAYDRFVIAGEGMARAYVPASTSVFRFDCAYQLDNDKAKEVSDHYPIGMNLMPLRDTSTSTANIERTNIELMAVVVMIAVVQLLT